MIEPVDLIFGLGIIILNLIPILISRQKYLQITIPLSLLLAAVRVVVIH